MLGTGNVNKGTVSKRIRDLSFHQTPYTKCTSRIIFFSPYDMFSEQSSDILADSNYLEVDQLPGELLIIPTGWLHQVSIFID